MSPRLRFGVLFVASALAVAALFPTAPVLAQSPAVIRACVQQGSLQVRIIGPTEACRAPETLITWNVQGPVGPPGPKGDPTDVSGFARLREQNLFTQHNTFLDGVAGLTSGLDAGVSGYGSTIGVRGVANDGSATVHSVGVFGDARATEGSSIGVDAVAHSPGGIGLHALNTSLTGGVAIRALMNIPDPNNRNRDGVALEALNLRDGFPIGIRGDVIAPGGVAGWFTAFGAQGYSSEGGIAVKAENNNARKAAGDFTNFNNNGIGITARVLVEGIGNGAAAQFEAFGSNNLLVGIGNMGRVFRVDANGRGYFNGGTQLVGADFAEAVAVRGSRDEYEPGDVLAIDRDGTRRLTLSAEPYSTTVAGIYSTKPGVLATEYTIDDPAIGSEVPLAMVGIVPCKVTAANGAIARGDLLVTSPLPGYAMKGTDRTRMLGAIVGKALQPLQSGTGVILVLVTLQ